MNTIQRKPIELKKEKNTTSLDEIKTFIAMCDSRKKNFEEVLPSNITYAKFINVVKSALLANSFDIYSDNLKRDLFVECLKAAQDGLLIDNKQAAFVLFKGKITYLPMYQGILKRLYATKEIIRAFTQVVHKDDEFEIVLGDHPAIIHKPVIFERDISKKENIVCVYAIIETKNGVIHRECMSVKEVEAIRLRSTSLNSPAWHNDWAEMAKIKVLRRLCKWIQFAIAEEAILEEEETDSAAENPEMDQQSTQSIADQINAQVGLNDDHVVLESDTAAKEENTVLELSDEEWDTLQKNHAEKESYL